MYEKILRRMRDCVRSGDFVATMHALQEMLDDGLTASDIRRIVLTGRVRERQKDRTTDESKYVIDGHTCDGRAGTVVGKLGRARLVILTVYPW